MGVRNFLKRCKLLFLVVSLVCILILGLYKVNIQNDKSDCIRNIQMYFKYMSEKKIDKFNETVASNLQINDELQKENIRDNLVLMEIINLEEVNCNETIFKVKYRQVWNKTFIETGNESLSENIVDVSIHSVKQNNKWVIDRVE